METCSIIVLVLVSTMILIIIILIGGLTRDIFQMISRRQSHLPLKAIIVIFNLKGKADIWWEDVKHSIDIKAEDLSWHEFKRLFKKKYSLERYHDSKVRISMS